MGKPISNLNFPPSFYSDELEQLKKLPYQDVIASYKGKDPSKHSSKFRGVCLPAGSNRYICRVTDPNKKGKDIHVGSFDKVNLLMIVHIYIL